MTKTKVNKIKHPLELFEIFFKSITPEMCPPGMRRAGPRAMHLFWENRFLNVINGIQEKEFVLAGFSELPTVWLAAWNYQQAILDELEEDWGKLNTEYELANKQLLEVEPLNIKLEKKADTLQKLIDTALAAINEHYESDEVNALKFLDLKEILLGEKDLRDGVSA
ncbi:hypothetical protein [Acinetobacter pittii]|uniref:hypothetical protein n=1 Tax=Acinetobacter pittii TaxID=48296 RepID=UPI000F742D47|nr:hypothetical protein [Acinetobacter pittii]MCU4617846.1 hypothetical protein [Acinetobacter pittii]RSO25889.1 hypothetical protein EA764_09560 [Acinetobacter pittii]